MNLIRQLLLLSLLLFSATAVLAGYDEGIEYKKLAAPITTSDPGKVEVMELFWYGCPHCYHFEPKLQAWLKTKPANVVFVRVPAVFNKRWAFHAKVFYTAQILGIEEKMTPVIFNAMHVKHQKLASVDEVEALFVANGVSAADFNKAFNSFAVDAKVRRATDLSRRSGIDGVPSIIINGKYMTTGSLAGGNMGMLRVTDYLIKKESASSK
ncbi:MAG: thiol:disulfide interchange protein DsbA/DsbL [Candidatus Promineifilaceae bacterium]|jgi:thiol:disulfide interchange protein DsbA|nr:thiol:disulfide interchange protein DsbA/DsbL [Pseudomonadota bacterium]